MQRIFLSLLSLVILSCQNAIDIDLEKKKIQSKIDLIEQAHYNKDANQFFEPYVQNWNDLRNGLIRKIEKSDRLASTQAYLNSMEFQEMIQRDEPIIEISDDGTLASYMASLTIKGVLNETPIYWLVSWQNTLRKIDGDWKIIAAVNTEADKETSAEVLLNQIREKLGSLPSSDHLSIYANAECKGPTNLFKTLILSRQTDGRMEQISGNTHLILKHGKDSSWTFNVNTETLDTTIDEETRMFVQGHELHWLSFWPEHRYANAKLVGISTFKNQTAFNIEFNNALDRPANFYYSFDSYLPLGFELQIDDEQNIVTVEFDEWEKVADIAVFTKATFTQGDKIFEYDFIEIKLNEVNDSQFERKIGLIE